MQHADFAALCLCRGAVNEKFTDNTNLAVAVGVSFSSISKRRIKKLVPSFEGEHAKASINEPGAATYQYLLFLFS